MHEATKARQLRLGQEGRVERNLAGAFLGDVQRGLGRRPRSLPSQYFYDARGSRLFQWITNLPAYYLTGAEREILTTHGAALVRPLEGRPCTVVDLGAGDGHKTRLLLQRLAAGSPRVTYAPVDVSLEALDEACARVEAELPGVVTRPVRATYGAALRTLAAGGRSLGHEAPGAGGDSGRKLVLFLGSSLGNLEHSTALALLRALRRSLGPEDLLLLGLDLVKPLSVLEAAYDDPQGVTSAFNLNLLQRLNRELGADFDLAAYRHRATWDPLRPAMESWLEATRAQVVRVGGRTFELEAGERIHTEISCKYTERQIASFAADAGFTEVARFHDRRRWFTDLLWKPRAC
jgi:dimethylhistidine N-methyltransferase